MKKPLYPSLLLLLISTVANRTSALITLDDTYLQNEGRFSASQPHSIVIDSSWLLVNAHKPPLTYYKIKNGATTEQYQVDDCFESPGWSSLNPKPADARDDYRALWNDYRLVHLAKPIINIPPVKRASRFFQNFSDVFIVSHNSGATEQQIGTSKTQTTSKNLPLVMRYLPNSKSATEAECMMDPSNPHDEGAGVYVKDQSGNYLLLGILSRINPLYNPNKSTTEHATFVAENLIGKANAWIQNVLIAHALGGKDAVDSMGASGPPIPILGSPPPPTPNSIAPDPSAIQSVHGSILKRGKSMFAKGSSSS